MPQPFVSRTVAQATSLATSGNLRGSAVTFALKCFYLPLLNCAGVCLWNFIFSEHMLSLRLLKHSELRNDDAIGYN